MANRGKSVPNLTGGYTHYDDKGHKIGRSEPGLFGGYTTYDAKGHKIGRSEPGLFGGYTNYDAKGHKIGKSEPGLFGDYTHYDNNGHKTGTSSPSLFGGATHYDTGRKTGSGQNNYSGGGSGSGSGGCYIATCVYGSYDCPPVWTLRRFRDHTLAENFFGRLFIKLYYAISPTMVKWFGNTELFQRFWKARLDKMVASLQKKGVQDTPYNDNN